MIPVTSIQLLTLNWYYLYVPEPSTPNPAGGPYDWPLGPGVMVGVWVSRLL